MYKTTDSPRRRRKRGTRVRVRKSVKSTGEERASVGHNARRTGGDREVTSRRGRHRGVASSENVKVKVTGRVRVSVAIGESEPAHKPGWPPGSLSAGGTRAPAGVAVLGLAGNPPLPKEAGPDPPPGLPHMKRASGRLQRSQPAGRVIGSVDKSRGECCDSQRGLCLCCTTPREPAPPPQTKKKVLSSLSPITYSL
eukprot:scaffold8721_cov149-Isochrysis_galbana.AAC.2